MNKRLLLLLFLSFILVFASSCSSGYNEKKILRKVRKEMAEHKKRLQVCADSTVNLSFKGIVLAEPIRATMNAAQKAGNIKNLKFEKGGSATCKADIFLPDREKPLTVDVKVTSYQDTITSFLILSDVYETYSALIDLYKEKYNVDYASTDNRSGSDSFVWSFKNQTLRVTDFYRVEEEIYVKNPKMKSVENKYGVNYNRYFKAVSILYSDNRQCAKVEQVEKEEQEKELAIEQERNRKKHISDSIKQEQLKAKSKNQDI
jgi:hypothetical protein